MLFDHEEIQIMSNAAQPQLREPNRSELVSKHIIKDFFGATKLCGTRILELGPGQYDFARIIGAAGATVVSIDHDPAVVALGQKRGYQVIFADFRTFDWSTLDSKFDGLYCRGSISAQWFREAELYSAFIHRICSVIKPDGWGWLAPWHGVLVESPPKHVKMMLDAERHSFERNGFAVFDLTPTRARRYLQALSPQPDFVDDPPLLFLRGLDFPPLGQ